MIPVYKTILLATDLSPNSAHALRHAVGIARGHDSRIFLLHVLADIEPAVLNYVSTVIGEEKLVSLELEHKDAVKAEIRERIREFARNELADHPEDLQRITDIEVHHGHPLSLILETADRLAADLIVLGSHGKGRLKYAFLGSVAEKILRKSQRPVLVIPLQES